MNPTDPLAVQQFIYTASISTSRSSESLTSLSDVDLAKALNLVGRDPDELHPTLAGLLLIGRQEALEEHVPGHEVAFQVLRGQNISVNEFYQWPILRAIERISEAFAVRQESQELNIGAYRVDVPSYDLRAFREALNNAFTHRDYTKLGAIHVQIQEHFIRIQNPGGFVQGVRLDNLLVTGPQPRNPRLADIFQRIGLVERTGRGINLIFAGQLKYGRLPPDYSRTTDTSVVVTLPGGQADLDFVRFIYLEESRRGRNFSIDDLLILNRLHRERETDLELTSKIIQKSEVECRSILEELVEDGITERRGRGRSARYYFTASSYRQLGSPVAYVRRRGFDSIQMEQMIIQYIRSHGSINRTEVTNLCRITSLQASNLLRRLRRQGKLVMNGLPYSHATYYTLGSGIE